MIETERFRFRRPRLADGEAVVGYLDDYETVSMLARVPYPYGRSDWVGFCDYLSEAQCWEDAFAIAGRHTDEIMGVISLTYEQDERADPTLGFWLGKPFRRRGIMTEAVLALVSRTFEETDVTGIVSGCLFDNAASAALHRRLGFSVVGENMVQTLARGPVPVRHIDLHLSRTAFFNRSS